MDFVKEQIKKSYQIKKDILADEKLVASIQKACEKTIAAYQLGNKAVIAGNGGSAADAQHIAAEFVSRFYFDRPALPAIALTTDTSILTAIGNDYGYEDLFSRQIEANANEGDIFLALSTSGNSANILKALQKARQKQVYTIGLSGQDGGKMYQECDLCICVPSRETPRIQEAHILIGHIICAAVEQAMFAQK